MSYYVMNISRDGRKPTYAHTSYESACDEAERLSERNPGKVFLVLEAIRTFQVHPEVVEHDIITVAENGTLQTETIETEALCNCRGCVEFRRREARQRWLEEERIRQAEENRNAAIRRTFRNDGYQEARESIPMPSDEDIPF